MSFAACGEARDAELVPTRGGGEREGKEWVIDRSVIAWSLVTLSLFNCVGFSDVGFPVVGFSDDGLSNVNCTQDYRQQEKWRPRLADRSKSKDVP